jgi:hypothetical protein
MALKEILGLFISPVAGIFQKREERKLIQKQIEGKLAEKKADNAAQVVFNDQEWEQIAAQQKQNSWTDEYATVSVLSVFNLILVGGIASAFGHEQLLRGVGIAVSALVSAGVDIGFLIEAVTLAAVGMTVWRKI